MNRYLALPLAGSLLLFASYLFVETNSHAAAEPGSSRSAAVASHFHGELIGIEEAQRILVQDWYTEDTERMLFSRARPATPPVYAFAKLDRPAQDRRQLFFTGLLHIVGEKKQTSVPVVMDRISRSIFVFQEDKWLSHQDWLDKHAPDRPTG